MSDTTGNGRDGFEGWGFGSPSSGPAGTAPGSAGAGADAVTAVNPVVGDDADHGAHEADDATSTASGAAAPSGAARQRTGARTAGRTSAGTGSRRPARPGPARLEIRRIDLLSVLRISAAVSVIWFLVWMIALAILYAGLQAMGVFSSIGELIGGFEGLTFGTVLAGGAGLGLLWAVLGVLLSVVAAAIFNACSGIAGGIEVEVERS
ncbi:DUF3566 domain-containing protein [Corynebacterium sp. 335C]